MSLFKSLGAAAVLALAVPFAASAATSLATIAYDYGDGSNPNAGSDTPTGWNGDPPSQRDPINADNVRMRDLSTRNGYNQFIQVFDLDIPELAGATITSFTITLNYSHVDTAPVDNGTPGDGGLDDTGELWYARILGDDNSTLNDDFFKVVPGVGTGLASDTGTFSFTLDASNDGSNFGSERADTGTTPVSNSAFQNAVNNESLRLRFREESGGEDIMWLDSAQIEVFGTPQPVPLPASGFLLIGAVGGVIALKRRKTAS